MGLREKDSFCTYTVWGGGGGGYVPHDRLYNHGEYYIQQYSPESILI